MRKGGRVRAGVPEGLERVRVRAALHRVPRLGAVPQLRRRLARRAHGHVYALLPLAGRRHHVRGRRHRRSAPPGGRVPVCEGGEGGAAPALGAGARVRVGVGVVFVFGAGVRLVVVSRGGRVELRALFDPAKDRALFL